MHIGSSQKVLGEQKRPDAKGCALCSRYMKFQTGPNKSVVTDPCLPGPGAGLGLTKHGTRKVLN